MKICTANYAPHVIIVSANEFQTLTNSFQRKRHEIHRAGLLDDKLLQLLHPPEVQVTCRKQSLTKAKRITGFLLLNFSTDFIIDISVSLSIIYNYNICMAFPSGAEIAKEMKEKEQSMLKKEPTKGFSIIIRLYVKIVMSLL